MAASDPTMAVPTPTGALQGVAAFSWDGSAWQPAGRAGPSVATPTGVLQGVAPFTWDGSVWQPTGRATYGVATPSGVLDGVAVYTWSGSAWVPPGGTEAPSTPSGALRGVASFSWDGSAWQPAAQAGPSVATPFGVLDGVAMFNWSGTAWAAVGAPSLDLSFMTPGTLPSGVTFTRASTGTYIDATGTMQTATTNTPRWDYDPVTHVLRGLLIEEVRTNALPNSTGAGGWAINGVTTTTAAGTAPDATNTLMKIAETATTTVHYVNNATISVTAGTAYTWSCYAKAAEVRYVELFIDTPSGVWAVFDLQAGTITSGPFVISTATAPTATIQNVGNGIYRCAVSAVVATTTTTARIGVVLALTAAPGFAPSYAGTAGNGLLVWGYQIEAGAFATSYIPTTAAAVTRAVEVCQTPTGAWFTSNATLSFGVEIMLNSNVSRTLGGISDTVLANSLYLGTGSGGAYQALRAGTGGGTATDGASTLAVVQKVCASYNATTMAVCGNGGTVAPLAITAPALTTATRVGIGNDPWGLTTAFCGWMRRVRYWPRALSNAELQSVTT